MDTIAQADSSAQRIRQLFSCSSATSQRAQIRGGRSDAASKSSTEKSECSYEWRWSGHSPLPLCCFSGTHHLRSSRIGKRSVPLRPGHPHRPGEPSRTTSHQFSCPCRKSRGKSIPGRCTACGPVGLGRASAGRRKRVRARACIVCVTLELFYIPAMTPFCADRWSPPEFKDISGTTTENVLFCL